MVSFIEMRIIAEHRAVRSTNVSVLKLANRYFLLPYWHWSFGSRIIINYNFMTQNPLRIRARQPNSDFKMTFQRPSWRSCIQYRCDDTPGVIGILDRNLRYKSELYFLTMLFLNFFRINIELASRPIMFKLRVYETGTSSRLRNLN